MAKARHSLEAMNYDVEKVLLVRGGDVLAHCSLLLVAGPKAPLLPPEVGGGARLPRGGRERVSSCSIRSLRTGLEPWSGSTAWWWTIRS